MPMIFADNRGAYQGDLPLATLQAILRNTIYNPALPIGGWNAANQTVSITKGAHQGTWYGPERDYYFDVSVNGGLDLHCLIPRNANANTSVLEIC